MSKSCWVVLKHVSKNFSKLFGFQNFSKLQEKFQKAFDFLHVNFISFIFEKLSIPAIVNNVSSVPRSLIKADKLIRFPLVDCPLPLLQNYRYSEMLRRQGFMLCCPRMQSIRIKLIDFQLISLSTLSQKRSLTAQHIPFDSEDLLVLIANSNVKHELSSSEYPTRRKQCNEALKLMGLKSYRDAKLSHLRGEFWARTKLICKFDYECVDLGMDIDREKIVLCNQSWEKLQIWLQTILNDDIWKTQIDVH